MPTIFRAALYAALFVGFVLIYLPARVLAWVGIAHPAQAGFAQVIGALIGTAGLLIALWCVAAFATVGKGTPAPFDPPRRLVVRGPYRIVRNPMCMGAAVALAGAASFYASFWLLAYAATLFVVCDLFVVFYEEPHLRLAFGEEYEAYCDKVRRWRPRIAVGGPKRRA